MSFHERDWKGYFDRLNETAQRRGRGRVLCMETVTEVRSRASGSRTPRLDRARARTALLGHLLEGELKQ